LNAFLLSALQHYGYFALWLIVFLAAAGAPISGSLLLFAAGAFAALGDLNIFILFPVAVSAAVAGDNLTYYIGWRVGAPILDWIARRRHFRWFTIQTIERGRAYFRRRTAWAIFITRFLIVVLGGSINLLAGLERYPYQKFLFWDVFGQILSVLLSLGLGFVFAASWEEVASIFGAFSTLVLVLLIVAGIAGLIIRDIRSRRRRTRAAASEAEAQLQAQSQETSQLIESPVAHDSGPLTPKNVGEN
jgi:membrane-associated protein